MVATDDASRPESVLKPVDRFDWERIIRRMDMPSGAKYLALMLATYADQDGTRVHPGVELLARVMCVSEKTVDRSLKVLRELGLVTLVKKGNRHAKQADEYRLTASAELLGRMLDPDESAGHG
jgi:DNA-binding HxlR family transcriptional regulator